ARRDAGCTRRRREEAVLTFSPRPISGSCGDAARVHPLARGVQFSGGNASWRLHRDRARVPRTRVLAARVPVLDHRARSRARVPEAAHAWRALRLGDPTASRQGQVSLSPWPHVRRSPIGMLVVPVLTSLTQGWTMGWASAPYDPRWADRHPRRAALMALAGPLGNLAIALAAFGLLRAGLAFGVFEAPHTLSVQPLVDS